eukprot:3674363-Pyramimonas_sp.AAC.1
MQRASVTAAADAAGHVGALRLRSAARNSRRLGEISLSRIVEASAISRIGRASKTNAAVAGQTLGCEPAGRLPPSSIGKDVSGRSGPAAVVEMSALMGTVAINCRGAELIYRRGDLRRFADFGSLVHGDTGQPTTPCCPAWVKVEQYIMSLLVKTHQGFGLANACAVATIAAS